MELILRSGLKKRRSKLRQLLVLCLAVLLSSASLVLFFADGASSYNIDISTLLAPPNNEDAARILQIRNPIRHVHEAVPQQMKFISKRRYLGGRPGSFPPMCSSKCAHCTPCKPVHVPVKPGPPRTLPTEYYPEAWRCKCGNKLYMP